MAKFTTPPGCFGLLQPKNGTKPSLIQISDSHGLAFLVVLARFWRLSGVLKSDSVLFSRIGRSSRFVWSFWAVE